MNYTLNDMVERVQQRTPSPPPSTPTNACFPVAPTNTPVTPFDLNPLHKTFPTASRLSKRPYKHTTRKAREDQLKRGINDLLSSASDFSPKPIQTGSEVDVELLGRSEEAEALRQASARNDVQKVIALLDAGVHPDSPDIRQRSPLHFACSAGCTLTSRALIMYGADVERPDINGNRPLHLAVIGNHMDIVLNLLRAGAKAESGDANNRTPLDLARIRLQMIKRNSPDSGRSTFGVHESDYRRFRPPESDEERWERDLAFAGWSREELIQQVGQILEMLRFCLPETSPASSPNWNGGPSEAKHTRRHNVLTVETLDELTQRLSNIAAYDEESGVVDELEALLEGLKLTKGLDADQGAEKGEVREDGRKLAYRNGTRESARNSAIGIRRILAFNG